METPFHLLFDIDDPESWLPQVPNPQPIPLGYQALPDSLFPSESGESSPESPSTAQALPIISSSPAEQLPATPPTLGASGDQSKPTGSGLVQGKCLLLTWSQAPNLTKDVIKSHLTSLGELESLAVGQEAHKEGGTHFHACAIFKTKISRRPTAFKILGYHPNVRVANAKCSTLLESMTNMWNYVQKEDQDPLLMGPGPKAPKRTRNSLYLEATEIAVEQSVDAALDFVRQNAAGDYVTKLDCISRSLVSHRNKKTRHLVPARPLSEFTLPFILPPEWRVMFFWGKSGVGKTQLAKALLPEASIVRHRNQLADCDFSKGVIFDDFDVSHWPPTAVIHLLDWDEVTGTDIKHGYVIIPPHTRKIFTFNKEPLQWCPPSTSPEQLAAIFRRMFIQELNSSLF